MAIGKNKNKELTIKVTLDKKGAAKVNVAKPTKSIDHIAENGGKNKPQQPKPFLTKKKIILTFVFLLIAIGFAIITVRPILKVDWNSFNLSVGTGIARNWGWLWLSLILIHMFLNLIRGYCTFVPRLVKWGYKISFKDYMLYSITLCFVSAVSPSSIISDPYTIFWFKTQGIPTSKVVSMYFTNTLLWQVSQILLTMPFFIICCLDADKLIKKSPADELLFSMICIGVILDYVGLLFFILINWSKSFHYFCSRIFNWFKKKLHMKYHTKEQSKKKYKQKATLKQSFAESMKDWKTSSIILLANLVGDLLGILSMVWCLNLVQNTIVYSGNEPQLVYITFDIGKVLLSVRLATPANRLNFLPGQAMGYPAAIMELLNVYGAWVIHPQEFGQKGELQQHVVSNSLLAGQIFFGWIPAIAGIAGFGVVTARQVKASNQGKLFRK